MSAHGEALNTQLVDQVIRAFERQWSSAPTYVVHAPGRVNIIGEHTDYNAGFVLPCSLHYGTVVAARPRADKVVNVIALDYRGHQVQFNAQLPISASHRAPWADYVKGVVHVFLQRGYQVGGLDLMIGGDVPQGAGLSSSASLQVALGWLFSEMNALELSRAEVALYAQQAENDFVGCQCGVMDQLTSALGHAEHALLIDCQSLETQHVPLPDDLELVIINSHVRRELVESEYNARRAQCEEAAKTLGLTSLREADLTTLERSRELLSEVVYRRARHVITENERTLAAVQALSSGDLVELGALMRASHESLRVDFEVTVPPVDELVNLTNDFIDGRGGARMTGGGFGGCIVAAVPRELVQSLSEYVVPEYLARTGLKASIYSGDVGAGVRSLGES